uniref:Uncharacterized protein n=1 Tax=Anguilla anguilla TaxID=7936 RepID=A0A0E9REG6_ANGAN
MDEFRLFNRDRCSLQLSKTHCSPRHFSNIFPLFWDTTNALAF